MTYHIIIQQERRVSTPEAPRQLAIPIRTSVPTGNTIATPMGALPEYVAGPQQLHTMSAAGLPENLADAQFVGVFEWDGISPYVIQHKGDYSARTMGYAGWPEITKEEFDALPVPDAGL